MCGISGILFRDPRRRPDAERLRAMNDSLRHRGPDDGREEILGPVGLAHRRLSIIDLSEAGAQPMRNADGTLWVVFNGEIYNFQRLRAELEGRYAFRSRTDTEVLLHLYAEHGDAMVDRLDGMFAFCLVDLPRRRALFARDPFGIKPLYFAFDDERLVFGSELKALLASGTVTRELDPAAVNDFFDFDWVPAPRCVFRGVEKLPPAHAMSVSLDDWTRRAWRYWTPRWRASAPRRLDAWADEVEGALDAIVRDQLVADVPIGTFLSGGIDSTLVTAAAARVGGAPPQTFTAVFPQDAAFSEEPYARQVAEALGVRAVFEQVPQASLGWLDELAWYYDEPFADSSQIPTFAVCRAARRHVKVILSGDGGDELFGGYRHHRLARVTGLLERLPLRPVAPALGALAGRLPDDHRARDWARRFALPAEERALSFARLPGQGYHLSVLPPERRASEAERFWHLRSHAADLAYAPPVARAQLYDLQLYLPSDMLVKVDRASMANSLEVRVPVLTRSLCELALTLPEALRHGAREGKHVLRRLVERRFGRALAYRRKRGFAVPLHRWVREGVTAEERARVLDGGAVRAGWLDRGAVARLFDEVAAGPAAARRGRASRTEQLFRVLVFDRWWRRHVEGAA